MPRQFLFVYPWAGAGGVEKSLITRISFLSKRYPSDFFCCHFDTDAGAYKAFKRCVSMLPNVSTSLGKLDRSTLNFDLIFVIDSPKYRDLFLRKKLKYVYESHSTYPSSIRYLSRLRPTETLVVPSSSMRDMVVLPRVGLKAMQLFVLPNLLQPGTNSPAESIELPLWNKTPVLFFGRMDSLKAPEELIRAAHLVKDFSRNHILVFAGPLGHGVDMFKELRGSGLDFVMLPSIPFDKTESFLKAVALRNGTYVTCSRAESLGLSLLEAYMAGLRIVATDIPAHRLILESNKFVSFYPPGQIVELAKELSNLNHRDLGSSAELDTRGMEDRFVQTWEAILSNRGIS